MIDNIFDLLDVGLFAGLAWFIIRYALSRIDESHKALIAYLREDNQSKIDLTNHVSDSLARNTEALDSLQKYMEEHDENARARHGELIEIIAKIDGKL